MKDVTPLYFVYKIPHRLVYKIPYRRARAWPSGFLGRVRRASKGILHTRRDGTIAPRTSCAAGPTAWGNTITALSGMAWPKTHSRNALGTYKTLAIDFSG